MPYLSPTRPPRRRSSLRHGSSLGGESSTPSSLPFGLAYCRRRSRGYRAWNLRSGSDAWNPILFPFSHLQRVWERSNSFVSLGDGRAGKPFEERIGSRPSQRPLGDQQHLNYRGVGAFAAPPVDFCLRIGQQVLQQSFAVIRTDEPDGVCIVQNDRQLNISCAS